MIVYGWNVVCVGSDGEEGWCNGGKIIGIKYCEWYDVVLLE